jgi:hypothetical protein
MGYNYWGIDAHTNTTTDARGVQFNSIFQLSNDVEGVLVGMTDVGPSFTGSGAPNQVYTKYTPSMAQPQLINVYDQLYNLGLSSQPWISTFDIG